MSVLLDLEAADSDIQGWLSAAGFRTVGTAMSSQEAMDRAVNLPAAFSIYDGSRSAGRLVSGSKRQLRDPLVFSIAFVGQTLVSAGAAPKIAYSLILAGERALGGKTPSTCLSPLTFVRDSWVGSKGPKFCYVAQFRTKAEDFL